MSANEAVLLEPKVKFLNAGSRIDCASCGLIFWLTDLYENARRGDHKSFYCPNGHTNFFPQETEAERFKRLHKNAEDRAARLTAERDQLEASRRAWKGQVTKLRKRVVEGECPLCGQHLRDLARHIGRVHPEAAAELPEAEATA